MENLTTRLERLKRDAVESASAGQVRDWASVRLAHRDAVATRRAANTRGVSTLDTRDPRSLMGDKVPETLFILGSGPSVNRLSSQNLDEVERGFSIGVNSWILHPFVPNVYAFEPSESLDYLNESQVLREVLARKLELGQDSRILHLRPHASTAQALEVLPPDSLAHRFSYYGRTALTTHLVSNLERDLTRLLQAHSRERLPAEILLDSGGSVGRMVSLGIFFGFQKIVLVGVDLSRNQYFFEDDPTYLEDLGIASYNPWKSRTEHHETQQRTNRAFVATEFLGALAKVSKARGGPEMFVANNQSLLSQVMPQYEWSVRD